MSTTTLLIIILIILLVGGGGYGYRSGWGGGPVGVIGLVLVVLLVLLLVGCGENPVDDGKQPSRLQYIVNDAAPRTSRYPCARVTNSVPSGPPTRAARRAHHDIFLREQVTRESWPKTMDSRVST